MSFDFAAQIEKVLQDRKTELQSEFHDAARKCCARYLSTGQKRIKAMET
jgi:hypothetical protein